MSGTYTDYVLDPSDSELFDKLWAKLRKQLRRELARRGLLDMKPSVVGMPGADWNAVMDDLLQEVFLWVFVERLQNLRNQLGNDKYDGIDGIVVLQIRHCLTHLQRLHDPIGYRTYELTHKAVSECVEAGELVADPKGKVRNETALAFGGGDTGKEHPRPGMNPRATSKRRPTGFRAEARGTSAAGNVPGALAPEPEGRPSNVARGFSPGWECQWVDELLPDFMTARYRGVTPVVQQLRGLILGLRDAGVETFRFKQLVDPLKREIGRRWLAVWSENEGSHVPSHREADLYGLDRCVAGKIDEERKKKTREDLARTWTFLRATREERNGHLPSNTKLADEVGVDRSRVPTLLETLKTMVEDCLSGQTEPR